MIEHVTASILEKVATEGYRRGFDEGWAAARLTLEYSYKHGGKSHGHMILMVGFKP